MYLDERLDIMPTSPAILMNMGLAQAYAQNHQGAVASLRRSVDVNRRQLVCASATSPTIHDRGS